MHEVGVLSSMLCTVEQIMKDEELTTVDKIVLEVGELSGVVPHYMEECWPAATYKTQFVDTKLEMVVIPGEIHCNKCGHEFNAIKHNLRCPKCNNMDDFEPLSGQELIIKEIQGC